MFQFLGFPRSKYNSREFDAKNPRELMAIAFSDEAVVKISWNSVDNFLCQINANEVDTHTKFWRCVDLNQFEKV